MRKVLFILLFILVSCGEKNKSDDRVTPQNNEYKIKMSTSAIPLSRGVVLPGHLNRVYSALQSKGEVSQSLAMQAQVLEEALAYERRTGQNLNEAGVFGNMMKLARLIPSQMRMDGLKNAYLSVLRSKHSSEVELNINNGTLVDPMVEGRMNSLSASKLFDFMLRAKNLNAGKNLVMIFQNGHVTPGFLVRPNPAQNRNAGYRPKWNLIGIESTNKGMGFLHFGDPDNFNGDLQIIDADEFLMTELFKGYLRNPLRSVRRALRRTCQKFSLSCNRFPSLHNNNFNRNWVSSNGFFVYRWSSVSVHSIFAFGSLQVFGSINRTAFSHRVVTGARYINNSYYIQGFLP